MEGEDKKEEIEKEEPAPESVPPEEDKEEEGVSEKEVPKERVSEDKKEADEKEKEIVEEVKAENPKEENEIHNKTLRKVFLGLGVITIIIMVSFFVINSANHFNYNGLTGNVVKEGDILFWQTSIPVIYGGKEVPYNFFLRNDPRKLDSVLFDGEIVLLKNMVIDSTQEFVCDGTGIISTINLKNLYEVIGTKVIKDDTAGCDPGGRYMFLRIQEGNETSIEQFGPACYNLNVNNCEILQVTERFMVETLLEVNNMREESRSAKI